MDLLTGGLDQLLDFGGGGAASQAAPPAPAPGKFAVKINLNGNLWGYQPSLYNCYTGGPISRRYKAILKNILGLFWSHYRVK